jgi:hypothetical protein
LGERLDRTQEVAGSSPASSIREKACNPGSFDLFQGIWISRKSRDLEDAAVYYRLRKGRERGVRVCTEAHCGRPIPPLANGRRRYCDAHGSGAARVRRHRHGAAVLNRFVRVVE